MVDTIEFQAEARSAVGTGAARATRRAGRIPAVIYGDRKDPMTISVDAKSFIQVANSAGFFATLFDIKLDQDTVKVLPRDMQLDPVTDVPIHVDFLRVSATTEITVAVPMEFLDEEECDGLRRGGVLNVVRYEVEIVCTPDNLPSSLSASLAGLDIGDGVHISDVTLPEGVRPAIDDRDFTIATIAAPTIMEEPTEEEEGEEGEEGELLEEGEEGEAEEGEEAAPSEDES